MEENKTCKQCKQKNCASDQSEYCEDCFAYNFLDLPYADSDNDDEFWLDDQCPNCGTGYDEIDYEYQICHLCGYNNTIPEIDFDQEDQDNDPNDSRNL